MPPAVVTLTLIDGNAVDKEYTFDFDTTCVIGRASDCDIQISSDFEHRDVSRHHCLLVIQPPLVRIRDLGSLNGTYVNGERVEPASASSTALGVTPYTAPPTRELQNGDLVGLGMSVCFRVLIQNSAAESRQAADWQDQAPHDAVRALWRMRMTGERATDVSHGALS